MKHRLFLMAMSVFVAGALTACPPTGGGGSQAEYDAGYDDGFAEDDWYWDGYFDGFDTLDDSPVYYDDSDIPFIDELSYDAGYWDGVWYAYNDGYFVDYHYAFILGFSEGYDAAFYPDYLDFLDNDVHIEYLNGGWGDGYNDGFSEGRIFGASDFEQGLSFDWEDALADYESGTDLYFEEIDLGTGAFGPVILYEYGADPADLKSSRPLRGKRAPLTIRSTDKGEPVDYATVDRPLIQEARAELEIAPSSAPRNPRPVRLEETYLVRIQGYLAFISKAASAPRARATAS